MLLPLTTIFFQLAASNPNALPKGCALKKHPTFESIDCGAAAGYAQTGRKDVFSTRGMEAAVLAGLQAQLGGAGEVVIDELKVAGEAVKTDRYDLKKPGLKTSSVWFVDGESGATRKLLACIGRPGADDARARCAEMFPFLVELAAVELGTPANAGNAPPDLFGRAVKVPAGCEARGGNTVKCGDVRLTVQTRVGAQMPLSGYASSIATNFRTQNMTVSERSRDCIVDGEKSQCTVLGVQDEGTIRIVLMGLRDYGDKKSAFITCMAPEFVGSVIPPPCDQLMSFPKPGASK